MSPERKAEMTDKLVLGWIKKVKKGNTFYRTHIGKGLEANNPIAEDFLVRAKNLDPKFMEEYYPGF